MKDFKSIEIHELRRVAAKEYGIKSVAKYRKADLVELLETMERHLAEAEAAKAKPATAKPKGKRCSICDIRPVGSPNRGSYGDRAQAKAMGYCTPCLTQAEMENAHSDYAHEARANASEGTASYPTESERAEMDACWVCHPELDESGESYVTRQQTSRKGMKMNVPVRADGATKAATVIERVTANTAASTEVKVIKGVTTLIIDFMDTRVTLVWDTRGGFDYPSSAVKTGAKVRKVRNVSAALSFIGA